MSYDIFRKLGTREQYNYIMKLEYQPSNLPNVGVHYGDIRAICIDALSSAYVSEGTLQCYHQQPHNQIIQYDVPLYEPSELKNELRKKVYIKLDDCMLLDEKEGTNIIHWKKGVDPNFSIDN